MPALVRALNSVDLPTFGRPTMPHLRLMAGSTAMGEMSGVAMSAPNGRGPILRAPSRRSAPALRIEADRGASCQAGGQQAVDAALDDRVHAEGDPSVHARIG